MYNKITLVGRVGADPEVKSTPNGTPVANFSICTSENWKDPNGQKQEKVTWFTCEAWKGLAEKVIGPYVKKGDLLLIVGKMDAHKYEKDGQKRTFWKVVVQDLKMLGSKQESSGGGGYQPQPASEDDIPF